MRVVLVGPYPVDPTRIAGGVQAAFFNLVEGLTAFQDIEPHVVSFVRDGRESRRLERGAVTVHYLPGRARFNYMTRFRGDRRSLGRAIEDLRPDIVHAQDAIVMGYITLRTVKQVPVVVSIHGIESPDILAKPVDRLRASLAAVHVQNYCVRNARYLVQPTTYPEEYFGSEIRGRIVDVGNPISDRFFAVDPAPEPGRVLYGGYITRGKRLLDLLRALELVRRSVPDAGLRVAGHESDPVYAAQVRECIAELGLEDHVSLLGALSPDQMLEEYRRAALFVLPSAHETSPMVIGEAMAVGVPVIATRIGGVPYLVEDGRTGFTVDVGDVEGLAGRMSQLLLDEQERAALGSAGRALALDRFRGVDVAARVRDVYRQALDDARNGR